MLSDTRFKHIYFPPNRLHFNPQSAFEQPLITFYPSIIAITHVTLALPFSSPLCRYRRVTMSDMHSIKMAEDEHNQRQENHMDSIVNQINYRLHRSNSIGNDNNYKWTETKQAEAPRTEESKPGDRRIIHRNSWPAIHNDPISPRGPMKCKSGKKTIPGPSCHRCNLLAIVVSSYHHRHHYFTIHCLSPSVFLFSCMTCSVIFLADKLISDRTETILINDTDRNVHRI